MYLYIVQHGAEDVCKIGISSDPYRRMIELQTGTPRELNLVATIRTPNKEVAQALESLMHFTFESKRLNGEWFEIPPLDVVEVYERFQDVMGQINQIENSITLHNTPNESVLNVRLSQEFVLKWIVENSDQYHSILKNFKRVGKRRTAQHLAVEMGFSESHYKTVERALGDQLK